VQAQAAMSANASAVDAEVGAGKPASAGTPAGDTSPLGASEKRPTSVGKYIYELVSVWVGGGYAGGCWVGYVWVRIGICRVIRMGGGAGCSRWMCMRCVADL